jgi:hypothetical protein
MSYTPPASEFPKDPALFTDFTDHDNHNDGTAHLCDNDSSNGQVAAATENSPDNDLNGGIVLLCQILPAMDALIGRCQFIFLQMC